MLRTATTLCPTKPNFEPLTSFRNRDGEGSKHFPSRRGTTTLVVGLVVRRAAQREGKYKQYYRQDRPRDVYESKRRKFAEYR
jgi:hypothetical protein